MKQFDPVYKSAKELGIAEYERRELIEAIPYFLALAPSEFRMCNWNDCICGHIARRNGRDSLEEYHVYSKPLSELYGIQGKAWKDISGDYSVAAATPAQAAKAIVAFLSGV